MKPFTQGAHVLACWQGRALFPALGCRIVRGFIESRARGVAGGAGSLRSSITLREPLCIVYFWLEH